MNPTATEPTTLNMSRTFSAPLERVFAAWTEPSQLRQWFKPPGSQSVDAEIDLRVGGHYRLTAHLASGEAWTVGGEYREIQPPVKIVYTWHWEDDPDWKNTDSLVTVEFLDRGDRTEVRLTHEKLPSEGSRDRHQHGWAGGFDRLDLLLKS